MAVLTVSAIPGDLIIQSELTLHQSKTLWQHARNQHDITIAFMADNPVEPLNILVLEPYFGGSHRAFLETWMALTTHHVHIRTLPARKWKWRMRGSAIWFAEQVAAMEERIDLIFTCDMVNVADLRALLPERRRSLPIITYFHENQLTYPIPDETDRDFQYGFTNITTCLTSDAVWFNSQSHREAFLDAAHALLRKMPDFVPAHVTDAIRDRSSVVYPLVEGPPDDSEPATTPNGAPIILWSHRWEYDKNPEPFFEALLELDADDVPFRLVILGETFRTAPDVFRAACSQLETRILHAGFVPDRRSYWSWLLRSDIVVSTAIQENFGLAMVEAMLAGCRPVLPNRLSYPELIPPELHAACLYDGDLSAALLAALAPQGDDSEPGVTDSIQRHATRSFLANAKRKEFDRALAAVVAGPIHVK